MENNDSAETREMLLLVGGAALVVLGVGLIASHPIVRRTLRAGIESVIPDFQGSVGSQLSEMVPDVQRYMKIRAM